VQVPDGEGVTNHTDPEPCAAYREVCGEALTGGGCRPAIEPRNISHPGRRGYVSGRQNERVRQREGPNGPAWSEIHVAFTLSVPARPLEFRVSRPPMRSLSLRPDD
jgi:hypothetical protein